MEEIDLCQVGKKWSIEEDQQLIQEYAKGLDIITISQNHKRLPSGIASRLVLLKVIEDKQHARGFTNYKKSDYYQKYLNSEKGKLHQERIVRNMDKQLTNEPNIDIKDSHKQNSTCDMNNIKKELKEIKTSIVELKEIVKAIHDVDVEKEIKGIKTSIAELKEMLKAIYEFDDC
jgi:hypothetical protein